VGEEDDFDSHIHFGHSRFAACTLPVPPLSGWVVAVCWLFGAFLFLLHRRIPFGWITHEELEENGGGERVIERVEGKDSWGMSCLVVSSPCLHFYFILFFWEACCVIVFAVSTFTLFCDLSLLLSIFFCFALSYIVGYLFLCFSSVLSTSDDVHDHSRCG